MINKKTYLLAAILTFAVIAGGFGLNWIFNAQREDVVQKNLLNIQSATSASELEMEYIMNFAKDKCSLLEQGKSDISKTLFETNKKLVQYNEYAIGDSEFKRLKTDQSVLYVKYWMFMLSAKENCGTNTTTILYFWDLSPESQQEEYVLDSVSEKYGSGALVVPLDYNFDLGIIRMLSKQFNVTKVPTIIINEKTKLEGPVSSAEIGKYMAP